MPPEGGDNDTICQKHAAAVSEPPRPPGCGDLQAMLHPDAHEEGGIAFVNKELLEQQRSAIVELIKDVRVRSRSPQLLLIS